MKEFICFSTTDVFVPVSQLSTRDLFYFLENLEIKQDFCLEFLVLFVIRTTSVMIPLFQIFLGIDFKKVSFLEYLGVFYEVNCGVDLGFLTHFFQKDV